MQSPNTVPFFSGKYMDNTCKVTISIIPENNPYINE